MAYDARRSPAAWVARQAARRERRFWAGGLLAVAAWAAMVVSLPESRLGVSLALVAAVAVVALRPHANRRAAEMLNWRKGAVAERAVGELLNELRRDGWIVMHDIEQAGEGNVDHIVWGPNGVYLVETKYRRYGDGDLRKAKRQAAKLSRVLQGWVTPVVCLYQRRGPVFRSEGVAVVPGQLLLGWLREQRNAPVEFERLARFADTV